MHTAEELRKLTDQRRAYDAEAFVDRIKTDFDGDTEKVARAGEGSIIYPNGSEKVASGPVVKLAIDLIKDDPAFATYSVRDEEVAGRAKLVISWRDDVEKDEEDT